MNAAQTRFGVLFLDLLDGLVAAFPQCRHTAKIHKWIKANPIRLNAIKLDWARFIAPYKILSFPRTGDYFERIHTELPNHLFNLLELTHKYRSMTGDKQAQDDLCSVLADLEMYATDDEEISPASVNVPYTVEEPTTPTSDIESDVNVTYVNVTSHTNRPARSHNGKSRFDDDELYDLCVKRTGDAGLCSALRETCSKIPLLSQLFGHATNEEIANQVVKMQGFLPLVMQMFSSGFPIESLISFAKERQPT